MVPNASSPASARARAPGDVVEQPGDLGRAEVRVDDEPGLLADARPPCPASFLSSSQTSAVRRHCQTMAQSMGSRVARSQTTRRLALVGDADGRDVVRRARPARCRAPASRLASTLAQISAGVVLDPAGLREVLRELGRRAAERLAVEGEDERGRAGGALVDGEEVLGHGPRGSEGKTSPSRVVYATMVQPGWSVTRSIRWRGARWPVPHRSGGWPERLQRPVQGARPRGRRTRGGPVVPALSFLD